MAQAFNQSMFNYLIKELNLARSSTEMLVFRLAETNFLNLEIKITYYRNRERDLQLFLSGEIDFVFCKNVPGLLMKVGILQYLPRYV